MYLEHSGHECAEDEGAPEVPFPQQTLLLNRIEHVVELGPNCLQVSPGKSHSEHNYFFITFPEIATDKRILMEHISLLDSDPKPVPDKNKSILTTNFSQQKMLTCTGTVRYRYLSLS